MNELFEPALAGICTRRPEGFLIEPAVPGVPTGDSVKGPVGKFCNGDGR